MLINIVQVFQDNKILRRIQMSKLIRALATLTSEQYYYICTPFLQISFSFSRTMNDKFGCRTFISLAVAIPTIPPPMTATSYSPPFWSLIREIKQGF